MVLVQVLGPLLKGGKGAAGGPGSQLHLESPGQGLPADSQGHQGQGQPQADPQGPQEFGHEAAGLPPVPGLHAFPSPAVFFSPRVSLATFSPLLRVAVNTQSPSFCSRVIRL